MESVWKSVLAAPSGGRSLKGGGVDHWLERYCSQSPGQRRTHSEYASACIDALMLYAASHSVYASVCMACIQANKLLRTPAYTLLTGTAWGVRAKAVGLARTNGYRTPTSVATYRLIS